MIHKVQSSTSQIEHVVSLLSAAAKKGIVVFMEGSKLKLSLPEDHAVEQDFIDTLRRNKEEIVAFLTDEAQSSLFLSRKEGPILSLERGHMGRFPLSFAQESLWVIDTLGDTTHYHIPALFSLDGNPDISILEYAFREIVNRHESLRTVFKQEKGEAYQEVLSANTWRLAYLDGSADNGRQSVQEVVESVIGQPFDLSKDYMLRVALYTQPTGRHLLVVVMHHIAADGWSLPVFVKELVELYKARLENKTPALPRLNVQYTDYAYWQRQCLDETVLNEKLAYWGKQLQGIASLELPLDFNRPTVQSTKGDTVSVTVDADLTSRLKALAKQEEATLYMLLISVCKILLYRYTGQVDISVGSPIANRRLPEVEPLIGYFVNTLVLRSDLSNNPDISELLAQVKRTTLQAYDHQDVPFGQVVNRIEKKRDRSRSPLFQVMFVLENTPVIPEIKLGDATLTPEDFAYNVSKFDLTFKVNELPEGLTITVEYCTELFLPQTISRLVNHYKNLLAAVVAPHTAIGKLELLSEGEKYQLLRDFGGREAITPADKTIIDLFNEQVRLTPQGGAVVYKDIELSYAQLDKLSNQLARYLVTNYGVEAENLIGIKLERSEWLIVSVLAVLKAGTAFLPIDPNYPPARIAYMESDSQCKAIIDEAFLGEFIHMQSQYADDALNNRPEASNLAYVIYTSGTTGQPKGAMIEHRGLVNVVFDQIALLGLTAGDHILQFASPSFDAFCYELILCLGCGGKLFIPSNHTQFSTPEMLDFINHNTIKLAILPPSYLALLQEGLRPFTTIVSVGEALNVGVTEYLQSKRIKVFNGYGPTETTIVAATADKPLIGNGKSTIGRPLHNVKVYLLDENDELVPFGCVGELCIGGVQVGRGYLNRPDLTAEKFVVNPFGKDKADRLYKTGDLARWLPDGNLEYLGRKDNQVKIKGFRIELGEIEAVLVQNESVQQAVVKVNEDHEGNKRLIAYVVSERAFDKKAVHSYLQSRLPKYMMPALYVALEALPLSPNGKVDRNALPDPEATLWTVDAYVAPANAMEEKLASIWRKLLSVDQVGTHHNFFELGGDSITAIQFVSRAKAQGLVFKVKDLFDHQTIAELANHVRQGDVTFSESGYLSGEVGLLPIQKHFFGEHYKVKDHFNQAVLLNIKRNIGVLQLEKSADLLLAQHDALRLQYDFSTEDYPIQRYGDYKASVEVVDLTKSTDTAAQITATCEAFQRSLSLEAGQLIRFVLIKTPDSDPYNRLFIVIHHLAVDGVSWRIIIEDLVTIISGEESAITPGLGSKTTSYRQWQLQLQAYTRNKLLRTEYAYWKDILQGYEPLIPKETADRETVQAQARHFSLQFSAAQTATLLQQTHQAYGTEISELLLSALAKTICEWADRREFVFALEGHGREEIFEQVDLSKTVGWFTSICPVRLRFSPDDSTAQLIIAVKEQLRSIPNKGIGYGILRYLSREDETANVLAVNFEQVIFNYLGNFDAKALTSGHLHWARESAGDNSSPDNQHPHTLSIGSMIREGCLHMTWSYDAAVFFPDTIEALATRYQQHLETIIQHCTAVAASIKTPTDYGLTGVASYAQLDAFLGGNYLYPLEDVYRLSPLQEGLLFHSLYAHDPNAYVVQFSCDFADGLNIDHFREAWKQIIAEHSILRTCFFHEVFNEPVQAVFNTQDLPLTVLDYSNLEGELLEKALTELLASDNQTPFDLTRPPLMRFTLICLPGSRVKMVWTNHHIILDGWSLPVLMGEFITNYKLLRSNRELPPVEVDQYKDLIVRVRGSSKVAGYNHWTSYLKGLEVPTLLPFVEKTTGRNKYFGNRVDQFRMDARSTQRLQDFAQQHRITLNTIIQGAWAYLLSRYTGLEQVIFGATVSGRSAGIDGIENRVGLYINTIPVCTTILNECIVTEWLLAVQTGHTASREYSHISLTEMQSISEVNGELFDSLLVFENYPVEAVTAAEPDFRIENIANQEQTNYSLLLCIGARETLSVDFSYNTSVLPQAVVQMIMGHFAVLLASFVDTKTYRIGDLQYLTAAETDQLLISHNAVSCNYPKEKVVHALFDDQAARYPNKVAVVFEGEEVTYRELAERSNRLAWVLREQGVGPDTIVGLLTDRSVTTIVGMLGILKAGGAYLPMGIEYPAERIKYMLTDSGAHMLLATGQVPQTDYGVKTFSVEEVLAACSTTTDLGNVNKPGDLCYVIYTSGTTGNPKGVMVEHRNVVRLFFTDDPLFDFSADDVWTLFHNPYFDFSVWEMYGALLHGGKLVVIPKMVARDPTRFLQRLKEHEVTVLNQTPSAFYNLIQADAEDHGGTLKLRYVIFGGEALKPTKLKYWYQKYPNIRLINMFGITETTVHVTYKEIGAPEIEQTVSNIGKPIPTLSAYLFDKHLKLVPRGVSGELFVGGEGVSRGYLNRDALTKEKFIANPYNPDERLYRSGDLVRQLESGELEYIGRIDNQVKIRGVRIELGEIESHLLKHPLIEDVVVTVRKQEKKEDALCAYLVGKEGLDIAEVRAFLSRLLPDYMVPAYVMQLALLPQTANGKVDKQQLPEPEISDGTTYVPPRNEQESKLAAIWSDVLKVNQPSINGNFFSLGGDSMKAIQLINAINKTFNAKVGIADLFLNPTMGDFASCLAASPMSRQHDPLIGEIEAEIARKRELFLASHPITAADAVEDVYPASDIQQGMIYHALKEQGIYHDQMVHIVRYPEAYIANLNQALSLMIKKHPILRSAFYQDDNASMQIVVFKDALPDVRYYTLVDKTGDEQRNLIKSTLEDDKKQSFDIARPGLFRLIVFTLSKNTHCLCFICHHAIIDGWSDANFNTELNNILIGLHKDPFFKPTPLKSSYRDFVINQAVESRRESVMKYWQNELADYKRFSFASSDDTDEFRTRKEKLPRKTQARLASAAQTYDNSIKHLCFAAFVYALSRFSYEQDITIGLVANNRPVVEDGDKILGCFLNTVPVRVIIPENGTWLDFTKRINEKLNTLRLYDQLSFLRIVDTIGEVPTGQNPITDILFNYTDFYVYNELEARDLSQPTDRDFLLENQEDDSGAGVGEVRNNSLFNFNINKTDEGLLLSLSYSTAFASRGTASQFFDYFRRALNMIVTEAELPINPDRLMPEAERHRLLVDFNNTRVDYPQEETILSLFAKQVARTPENVALKCDALTFSYREVKDRSDRMASYLQEREDIRAGDLVGLLMEREEYLIPAIFGILKAGAAYIPIDPNYPSERINAIIKDSGLKLIITRSRHLNVEVKTPRMIDLDASGTSILDQPIKPLTEPTKAEHLAYIIYTSGSTGKPKGVMIEHRSLYNVLRHLQDRYPLREQDVFLLKTTYCFDVSVAELFGWFLDGGALSLLPAGAEMDLEKLLDTIEKDQVTHINFVPTMFSIFLEELERRGLNKVRSLKYAFLAGEALPVELVRRFDTLHSGISLENIYGPTEGTIYSCAYATRDLKGSRRVPIGKPLSNTSLYVVDRGNQLQPMGVPGELCIGGRAVARGYVHDETLTREKFIPNLFKPGESLYRTGDLARWLPDGNLEYLGRIDNQVKIRGFRIELGEIENQLASHSQVKEAVVLIREKEGNKYLVAYYSSDEALLGDELNRYLSERLPEYMVPFHYVHLTKFPLTLNGKLDRKALPDPQIKATVAYAEPVTAEEKLLALAWTKVLGIEQVGVTDNFFRLGGDSIKSIQIISRMRGEGYELSVKDIFKHPTIRQAAARLKRLDALSDQSLVTGKAALTSVQRWFFNGSVVNKRHFNQSVMLHFSGVLPESTIRKIFSKLQEHHDALRIVFKKEGDSLVQMSLGPTMDFTVAVHDLRNEEDPGALTVIASRLQASIDLENGPLYKLGLFHLPEGSRLLIIIHHLIVDGISWRILFEDIETLYQQLTTGQSLSLPLKTDSFLSWSDHLLEYAKSKASLKAKKYWNTRSSQDVALIPRDFPDAQNRLIDNKLESLRLSREQTNQLLTEVNAPFNTQINDILLTVLLLSLKRKYGNDLIRIDLEGHGRENIGKEINVNRTIGWFTSIFPVWLRSEGNELGETIKEVKETLREIPNHGIDYMLHRYLQEPIEDASTSNSQIIFNYLGQFDSDTSGKSYSIAQEDKGDEISPAELTECDWSINGKVIHGQLEMNLWYSDKQYRKETIGDFVALYKACLVEVIDYCAHYERQELTPSDLTFKGLTIAQLDKLQQNYAIADVYRLSPMQKGMMFHAMLDAKASHYFQQMNCQIEGQLDVALVERSMNELIARYDILRTLFISEGYDNPIQVVLKERKVAFEYKDIREESLGGPRQEVIERYKLKDTAIPFDLSKDVLVRLIALQTADEEFELIWSYHHILMDGWCMSIILNEFRDTYSKYKKGKAIALAPVQPYSHYITWLENRGNEESTTFWRNYLDGYDALASLPRKERTSPKALPYNQEIHERVVDKELTKLLQEISLRYGVTLNTLLQTVWAILLARYNNTDDVVFGSVVSGRPSEIPGVETMVGLFINTIPVRVKLKAGASISELLREVQAAALESELHHYQPLSEIQSLSQLGQELLDHIFIFENYPVTDRIQASGKDHLDAYTVVKADAFEQTSYDLAIIVLPGETIKFRAHYNANVYGRNIIENVTKQVESIIHSIVRTPDLAVSDTSLYDTRQQDLIKAKLSCNLEEGITIETIQEKLGRSFREHSENCAIEYNDQSYSFAQLERQANKVAAALVAGQVPEGSFVGILCEDRYWSICAILGILKARTAFVPLETTLPISRLASMITRTRTRYIITDSDGEKCKHLEEKSNPITWLTVSELEKQEETVVESRRDYQLEDLVYVYFTSGTTGEPKGVVGKNKGLSHFIGWEINAFNINSSFRFSQFTNPGFDVFMRDIFAALCAGGTICIPADYTLSSGERIRQWIDTHKINLIHCVPSLFKLFAGEKLDQNLFADLKYILLAGEKILPYELKNWYSTFQNRIQLVNVYGPTETTLAKGYYLIQPSDSEKSYIPIKPITGTQFLILDKNLQVCAPKAIGEIYIRTPFRTAGYLNSGSVDAFMINAYGKDENDRIYKTGDLGREHENGEIEILGRQDQQVKIRGIRIELDDIKQNILQFPGVKDVVVVVKENGESEKFICAYYVPYQQMELTGLSEFLLSVLPRYMVPSYFILIENLPLLTNGKVDRKALPEPGVSSVDEQSAPANEMENKLMDIWAKVLRIKRDLISTNKSFFELGGHSVRIAHMINAIQQELSVKLKLGDVFEHNTIKKLAGRILSLGEGKTESIPQLGSRDTYSVSPAQERMYYQQLLYEGGVAYNISIPVEIKGEVDVIRLEKAFQTLMNRHEGLRTNFFLSENGVVQKITDRIDFKLQILGQNKYPTLEEAFLAFIKPFDLSKDTLIRGGLLQYEKGNLLFVDMHHIIADGASLNVLIQDFETIYLGKELPPLELRYVDYAGWIALGKGNLERQKEFWMNELSGELPQLELPVSRKRTKTNLYSASVKVLKINREAYEAIRKFTATANVSDFMFLLSIHYILLYKLSSNRDIIIGSDVIGRTHPALKHIVGTFVNVLPLRIKVKPGGSYAELLRDVRQCVLNAFENQDFQFDQMVAMLSGKEQMAQNPIVKVHFSFANAVDGNSGLKEFSYFPAESKKDEMTQYELKLEIREEQGKLNIYFIYSNELYEGDTIQLLMEYYHNILRAVLTDSSLDIEHVDMEGALDNFT